MGFLENLFGVRQNRSSVVAKERLAKVLLDDRYKLPPETKEQLRMELAEVLSRYLPSVDPEQIEIEILRGESSDTLKADVPLRRSTE